MDIQYNVEEVFGHTVIWYEKDGVRYSFGTDPSNSDYQAYLAEQSTPMVTDETASL